MLTEGEKTKLRLKSESFTEKAMRLESDRIDLNNYFERAKESIATDIEEKVLPRVHSVSEENRHIRRISMSQTTTIPSSEDNSVPARFYAQFKLEYEGNPIRGRNKIGTESWASFNERSGYQLEEIAKEYGLINIRIIPSDWEDFD